MSVKESPLAAVKRLYGTKEKLVDTVVSQLAKDSDESADELKARLSTASNKKLLRLAGALKQVSDKHGSRDKLVATVSAAQGKAKDADYVSKLQAMSVHGLLDLARAAK